MNEVAVIQCLQAQVCELQITRGIQLFTQELKVIFGQARVEQLHINGAFNVSTEITGILCFYFCLRGVAGFVINETKCFGA